ncbi:response regulator transcription factor [Cellulomonas fimi]|uniref:response regulator transcription factor n=1 Tax=Cellulomonas fimi TaxID=1708 RepID=UPI002359C2F3|nr:response regulator transcription factor [Cellulomonas fimi]
MTRVVVADDQPVVLQGFAAILGSAPDLEVVGTAADGRALVELVARTEPDVAVVDVRMPVLDGIAATQQVVARHPATRVLVLTTFDLDEYVLDALRAGASGFLLKDVTAERLVEAVRLVAEGSMLLGPNVTRRLVEDFSRRVRRPSPEFDTLTPRERDVALAAARGLSNAEIAGELFIGESTVKTHLSEVLRKLRCRDRVQLVVTVHEAGLLGD